MTPAVNDPRQVIKRLNYFGLAVVAITIFGVGGWAATAQLSGAVIGSGTIIVETFAKKVQHPTGGVVGQILVKEGDRVEAGQIVIRLDDTVPRATVGVIVAQLVELRAREGRLQAERDDAENLSFPSDLVARNKEANVATALADEEKLFHSRRTSRQGQREQLKERINQSKQEIIGLTAQQEAKANEIKFIGEELKGVAELYEKKLVPIVRFMQLQRDQARIQGERGNLIAEIARAKAKIVETELQILQLDRDFRTEVLKELRDAQGKIAELKERLVAAEDQLRRVDIPAPQSGVVHQLAVHTVGGVIGAQETIMLIIPHSDKLVVEAKIAPPDVDQVTLGARVSIQVMAGNRRTTPSVNGVVTHIAADLTKEQQTNLTYYIVRASIPDDEIKRLGDLKLLPGMPAEIFVQTQDRTPLEFLIKPLTDQIARTFRER